MKFLILSGTATGSDQVITSSIALMCVYLFLFQYHTVYITVSR